MGPCGLRNLGNPLTIAIRAPPSRWGPGPNPPRANRRSDTRRRVFTRGPAVVRACRTTWLGFRGLGGYKTATHLVERKLKTMPPKSKMKRATKERRIKKKPCRFCIDRTIEVSYRDVGRLKKYVSERGKIVPRRISGNCAKHQRMLTVAVKRARLIASFLRS